MTVHRLLFLCSRTVAGWGPFVESTQSEFLVPGRLEREGLYLIVYVDVYACFGNKNKPQEAFSDVRFCSSLVSQVFEHNVEVIVADNVLNGVILGRVNQKTVVVKLCVHWVDTLTVEKATILDGVCLSK